MTTNWLSASFSWLKRLTDDQRGQDLIEYALLAAAGCVAVIAVLPTTLQQPISHIYSGVMSVLARNGG